MGAELNRYTSGLHAAWLWAGPIYNSRWKSTLLKEVVVPATIGMGLKDYIQWKKPDIKEYILYECIGYEISKKAHIQRQKIDEWFLGLGWERGVMVTQTWDLFSELCKCAKIRLLWWLYYSVTILKFLTDWVKIVWEALDNTTKPTWYTLNFTHRTGTFMIHTFDLKKAVLYKKNSTTKKSQHLNYPPFLKIWVGNKALLARYASHENATLYWVLYGILSFNSDKKYIWSLFFFTFDSKGILVQKWITLYSMSLRW